MMRNPTAPTKVRDLYDDAREYSHFTSTRANRSYREFAKTSARQMTRRHARRALRNGRWDNL